MTATQSFADFCATADARNTIELNVRKWCLMLCEALQDDFLEESIRRQQFFSASGDNPEYHSKRIQELKDGKHLYEFSIESGRKYHKIVMETETQSKSVHAFVDKKTGEVYKAHHTKHLPKVFALTSASSLIVSLFSRIVTGQVVTCTSDLLY